MTTLGVAVSGVGLILNALASTTTTPRFVLMCLSVWGDKDGRIDGILSSGKRIMDVNKDPITFFPGTSFVPFRIAGMVEASETREQEQTGSQRGIVGVCYPDEDSRMDAI